MESMSVAQARRVALAAQGFLDPPHATPTMRTLMRTVGRTGVLQVDSVNVLQRAHYMPLYSRMGPYDIGLLRRANEGRPRRLVEYWAHVQALMPVDLWPHLQHRMDHYRERQYKWWKDVPRDLRDGLLAEIRDRGALTARDLDTGAPRAKDHWGWNWSQARIALDFLYMTGELAIAGRNGQFEVLYDLPERVIPPEVLVQPTPTPAEAHVELVRRAARSHGVATIQDLRDYYRMSVADTAAAVTTLVETGELVPVAVDGWKRPSERQRRARNELEALTASEGAGREAPKRAAYLHREARIPRRVNARALLSPFDPVVWERARTEALFDFFYRIEIYVPKDKRVHGYYVLPFLLGDRLVGRVDLKADRPGRRLLVQAAYAEPHAPAETAGELAEELWRLAGWLDLDDVVVAPRGDLAPALAVEIDAAAA